MELIDQERTAFKRTEIGEIPKDWKLERIDEFAKIKTGDKDTQDRLEEGSYPFYVRSQKVERINSFSFEGEAVLTSGDGVGVGKIFHYLNGKFDYHQRVYNIHNFRNDVSGKFFYYYFSNHFYDRVMSMTAKSSVDSVRREMISDMQIPLPPTLEEQNAIATTLSNTDDLIAGLEKLIAKKKAIKQGAMQRLLTPPSKGGKRLPGFSEEWEEKRLSEIAICLDNLRIPLNQSQRNDMSGTIPYCGANGIVDYVNDYTVDDDIILMAEDGGYFDEYKTRPIAYRMNGKCWVNNHAHIIKANSENCQNFLFYQLVHKNIMDYITGGTRAKLNKSALMNLPVWVVNDLKEQEAISRILNDMDIEIEALEAKKTKYEQVKQGMMQELLTGKTRLV
ncbi:restriction endonuclease subunit S [Gramella sp. KN1008]|uniref:restriction endonuclease subunit S n=1 Tax=Gramella sp. KN1008 TaxID=2529298 RepID=UPI0013F1570A|nr:restriction endonuclease subunit S [Gramella sp. KN1008]